MNAGSTRLLSQTHDLSFNLLAVDENQIGKLVNEADDVSKRLEWRMRFGRLGRNIERIHYRITGSNGCADLVVEAIEASHAQLTHQVITAIHFVD